MRDIFQFINENFGLFYVIGMLIFYFIGCIFLNIIGEVNTKAYIGMFFVCIFWILILWVSVFIIPFLAIAFIVHKLFHRKEE